MRRAYWPVKKPLSFANQVERKFEMVMLNLLRAEKGDLLAALQILVTGAHLCLYWAYSAVSFEINGITISD